jgi:hypothetical protein
MEMITNNNDLLRPGSQGILDGQPFEVRGRFRLWLEASVINYWTLRFNDGSAVLLSEGYGLYAIVQPFTPGQPVMTSELDQLGLTNTLEIVQGEHYFMKDKEICWKYETEGESLLAECTDQFVVYDLYAQGGKHLTLMECQPRQLTTYIVRYVDFASLQLSGLNENTPEPMAVVCTSCKTTLYIKTFPYAQSCSCACGARLVFKSDGQFRYRSKDKNNLDELTLPLGTPLTLKGIAYETIGYAWKEDDYGARWKEYVLYNRAEGYAFLSEYNGNWTYAREQGNSPVIAQNDPTSLTYKGINYRLYYKYKIKLLDTLGEFPYIIYDDITAVSAEFIHPPLMWVYEKSKDENIDWFLAEHIPRSTLQSQVSFPLPPKVGRGPLERRGYFDGWRLIQATLIAAVLLILVHTFVSLGQQDKTILKNNLEFRDSANSLTFVSPKFELTKWRSNLEFDLEAPVDNNWIEMEAYLINDATGSEQSIDELVQYYHGYEDGESWSEGQPTGHAYLSSIPSGRYYLRIEATRDTANIVWNSAKTLSLDVRTDVPNHRNLFIFLFLLLLFSIISYFWMRRADKERWDGSPYSPYKS